MRERSLSKTLVQGLDKIFASAWLDYRNVVAGTKCGKLLAIDVDTSRTTEIELPKVKQGSDEPIASVDNSGNRIVSLNGSKTLLLSSGFNPCHVSLLDVPNFSSVGTFVGHEDVIFSAAWVDDTHFITASRDKTLRFWAAQGRAACADGMDKSQYVCRWHDDRVREVKYEAETGMAASVSTDGRLVLWDPITKSCLRKEDRLKGTLREIACLGMRSNLLAVGSLKHVSLYDARSRDVTHVPVYEPREGGHRSFQPDDAEPGIGASVRSVGFRENFMTVGAGGGMILFMDLRNRKFLDIPGDAPVETGIRASQHLQSSLGHWDRDSLNTFMGMGLRPFEFKPSCYTHSWDPSGLRLFVGGGPAFIMARGCYASVWS